MKVLYVEDNPVDVDLTLRHLKKNAPDMEVRIARSQAEALKIIRNREFSTYDLVLTDMHLGDGDGIAVLSHIRGHSVPVSVVLLTGQGDEESAVAALKAGADDYVVKKTGYLKKLPRLLHNALTSYRQGEERKVTELNVLYLEHNEADIDLTRRHLQKHSSHIHLSVVSSVRAFYERLESAHGLFNFDVLLLDYRLPQENALEILKKLNEFDSKTPVILITGKGDEEIAVEALKLGAFDYLTKQPGYLFKLPSVIESAYYNMELMQKHEVLLESEAKFKTLVNNLNVGVYRTTPDDTGKFIEVNPALVSMFGYERREDFMAQEVSSLYMNPKDRKVFSEKLRKMGSVTNEELQLKKKDGTLLIGSISSVAVKGEKGEVKYFDSIIEDITETKQLQDQFIQAQKMESVGRLAGGVAHDFNNMLSVIKGHTELGLLDAPPEDPLYAHFQEILKATEGSTRIISQLLAFARKQTVVPKVIHLNDAVEGMLKMLRRLIGEDIDLVWNPDADLQRVTMDPSQIDQILANLCVNARDAIQGVGKVTIETQNVDMDARYCETRPHMVPGEYVMLRVSDDGSGMDTETIDQVFEPFFTTKEAGKGTGLGMSTVYGIVKQNQGFIHATSELGAGTIFDIYLPPYKGETENQAEAVEGSIPQGHGETVLLVEDDPTVLQLGKQMLERLGYVVLAMKSPNDAMEAVREYAGDIHLLMTDVIMPEMDGKQLAEEIQKIRPNIKRVYMSGYTSDIIATHGVLDQGVHFIEKPFSFDGVARKVREALDG